MVKQTIIFLSLFVVLIGPRRLNLLEIKRLEPYQNLFEGYRRIRLLSPFILKKEGDSWGVKLQRGSIGKFIEPYSDPRTRKIVDIQPLEGGFDVYFRRPPSRLASRLIPGHSPILGIKISSIDPDFSISNYKYLVLKMKEGEPQLPFDPDTWLYVELEDGRKVKIEVIPRMREIRIPISELTIRNDDGTVRIPKEINIIIGIRIPLDIAGYEGSFILGDTVRFEP